MFDILDLRLRTRDPFFAGCRRRARLADRFAERGDVRQGEPHAAIDEPVDRARERSLGLVQHAIDEIVGDGTGAERVRVEEGPDPLEPMARRWEEHTPELQSLMGSAYAVFCLNKQNTI